MNHFGRTPWPQCDLWTPLEHLERVSRAEVTGCNWLDLWNGYTMVLSSSFHSTAVNLHHLPLSANDLHSTFCCLSLQSCQKLSRPFVLQQRVNDDELHHLHYYVDFFAVVLVAGPSSSFSLDLLLLLHYSLRQLLSFFCDTGQSFHPRQGFLCCPHHRR